MCSLSVLNIYVCVKFGCKSASGYGHLGKTTQESFLWDTLYIRETKIKKKS